MAKVFVWPSSQYYEFPLSIFHLKLQEALSNSLFLQVLFLVFLFILSISKYLLLLSLFLDSLFYSPKLSLLVTRLGAPRLKLFLFVWCEQKQRRWAAQHLASVKLNFRII